MHFCHILSPSEPVEMMGAYDTQLCSPLSPIPSSSPAFLTENYEIVLDTGHAGDAAMPGADPGAK